MERMTKGALLCSALVVLFAYFYGYYNGKDSEELKNARTEISTLNATVAKYQVERDSLSYSLANIRIAESRSRDELDWMRKQLADIEAGTKTDIDRERNRCLRLAVRGQELLGRAERAIKFCEENCK